MVLMRIQAFLPENLVEHVSPPAQVDGVGGVWLVGSV